MTAVCYLCGRSGESTHTPLPTELGHEVVCPDCGTYHLETKLRLAWASAPLPQDTALKLRWWVRVSTDEERVVELTTAHWKDAALSARPPMTFSERIDTLVLYVAQQCGFPGQPTPPTSTAALAARLYLPTGSLFPFVNMVKALVSPHSNEPMSFTLTPDGWLRADELQRYGPKGGSAFVAMAFTDELKPVYDNAIRPALQACGYYGALRVDDPEHERAKDHEPRIDDRIMAGIRRARFLVVDVTGARPAVYFEAGFAMGLGIPIIWTCRKGDEKDMTFDTRQFEHIVWQDETDLRTRLEAKVRAHGFEAHD